MLCHIVYLDRLIRMLGNILYAGKDLPGHPGRNFPARYPLCKINQHRILQRIDIVCPAELFHLLDIIVAQVISLLRIQAAGYRSAGCERDDRDKNIFCLPQHVVGHDTLLGDGGGVCKHCFQIFHLCFRNIFISAQMDGEPAAEIAVKASDDWTDSESVGITGLKGKQALFLKYVGEQTISLLKIEFC